MVKERKHKEPTILDIIKRNSYPIPPQSNDDRRREGAKTGHFGIIELGEGWGEGEGEVQMFHLFCPRLQSWTE